MSSLRIDLDRSRSNLMEPWEYCLHWIKTIKPGKRGYRAACIRELEKATFGQYKFETINKGWGAKFEKRPPTVLKLLEANHTLRTLQVELSQIHSVVADLSDKVNKSLSV